MRRKQLCQHHAQDQIGEGRDHKGLHPSRAAQNAVRDQLRGYHKIERRDDLQKPDADIHCRTVRMIEEHIDQPASQEEIQHRHRHTDDPHKPDACAETVADAAELSRAEILCGEIGNTVAERRQRSDDQIIELDRRRIARCHGRAEIVDDALNDDIADRDKALLQNTRNCDHRDPAEQIQREQRRIALRPDPLKPPDHDRHRQQTADALTDKGRPRDTRYAHAKRRHKEDIRADIRNG